MKKKKIKKKRFWTHNIIFPFTFSSRTGCSVKLKSIQKDQNPLQAKSPFSLRLTHLFQVTHLLVLLLRKWKIDRINPTVVYCANKEEEGEGEEEEEKLNCFNCFLSK